MKSKTNNSKNSIKVTNIQERMKVEIYKDLLVELYNFAYEQAVKTNTVEKLHEIEGRFYGCVN